MSAKPVKISDRSYTMVNHSTFKTNLKISNSAFLPNSSFLKLRTGRKIIIFCCSKFKVIYLRLYFERAALSRKGNRKSQKLSLFDKMVEKYGSVPLHFNALEMKIIKFAIKFANWVSA